MEVSFSSFFWLPYHNLYNPIHKNFFEEDEIVKAAMTTGMISGSIAVCLSHPFDVIRTVKIVDDGNFGSLGNIALFRKIYDLHGLHGVFSGKFFFNGFLGFGAKFVRGMIGVTLWNTAFNTSRELFKSYGY